MRFILTILFCYSVAFGQSVYHVSNSGNDANSGTSALPFATIYKALAVAVSGDSILLNAGSTFQGNYTISTSNLKFNSYGSGANPIVTGLQTQSGFTNIGGNIWRAIADSAVTGLNFVKINNQLAIKGRYPNTGYITITAHSGDSSITAALGGTYTGYGIVVRVTPWVIDTSRIQSQVGNVLNLSTHLTYPPLTYGGNGCFLQGDSSLVDTVGEYSYNNATKALIVYSVGTPSVQISTRDTLIKLSHLTSISFNNIQFSGANKYLFYSDSSNHVYITNCNLDGSGKDGFVGQTIASNFDYNTIQNILNTGIAISNEYVQDCDSNRFTNNSIKRISHIAGMGSPGNGQGYGIVAFGDYCTFKYNKIDTVGYSGLNFIGKGDSVFYNTFNNFCFIKSDGGAIYTAIGVDSIQVASWSDSGSIVRGNIIENGIGNPDGIYIGANAGGVYLDENTSYVLVDSNSIHNTFFVALSIGNAHYNTVRDNNVYAGHNSDVLWVAGTASNGNVVKKNKFFASAGKYVTHMAANDVSETIDSNYISRWPSEGTFMYNQGSDQTLATWAAATPYDRHSNSTPPNVTIDLPLYFTNPTQSDSVINLGQTYIDFLGNTANSFTLKPFSSITLFKAINQIVPPTPPGKTSISNLKISIRSK